MFNYDFVLLALKKLRIDRTLRKDICIQLKIDPKTLYNWNITYKRLHITHNTKPKDLKEFHDNIINSSKINRMILPDKEINHINEFLINNPAMTVKKYMPIYNKKFKKSYSNSFMYKKLKDLGITRKRARTKIIPNIDKLIEKKRSWIN